ncbi:hypothetical protein ES703_94527 [subsurface metagenome]
MLTRQDRVRKEGSEYFTWYTPVTIAGAIATIEVAHQFPRSKKYEPLDWIEVCNNDAVDLTLIINADTFLPVPAGTIRTVDNHALWQVGIRNDDGAIDTSLNKIIVSLRRQPITIDDWARRRK